ncbi:hypothetical protein POM88_033606 [Heracleum sosnowskyi]|uniref:Uncharacterized protein n=1 Tax=Heracleum sosnowskyi TaxID=360622 RepID=A0AAD8HJN3_9APIA|nr:hypothetical protein POM88_033606 [Heracleum sosnowskyi]
MFVLDAAFKQILFTYIAVHIVHHTPISVVAEFSFESELFMMICQGMNAVVVICPAVVIAEKKIALSFVFALRSCVAFQILSHQLVSFCKITLMFCISSSHEGLRIILFLFSRTQHKIEMDKRDGQFGPQPMGVPPPQQMSRVV